MTDQIRSNGRLHQHRHSQPISTANISATASKMMTGIMVRLLIVPRHRQRRFLSPCMQHINNACAEYEMALGAIAAYTSTADKPAV